MESDSDLVQRTLAGETESFRALVERYQDAVYGVALSKTGSFADAEDLAQEIFLAAYESLQRLKTPAKFGSWLYGIALNKTKMHLRSQTLSRKSAVQTASNPLPADELATRNETRAAIISALKSLSDTHRETATLYYINGYSQKDISNFTNRPLGTIKRRLHDARKQLRKELVTMVESELKSSRPKREFTDRVLRRISRVRTWVCGDEVNGLLLLTDSKKRSMYLPVRQEEAQAIQPWLSGTPPEDATDIYSALLNTLDHFGCKVKEAVISEQKGVMIYTKLKLKAGRTVVEVDCRPSDAANFAVRADAPISVSEEIAARYTIKRKDGKPMSPAAAWRKARRPSAPIRPFRNVSDVIRALERRPGNIVARRALWNASQEEPTIPRKILDTTGAMEQITAWTKRSTKTEFDALSAGLLGSIYLGHLNFTKAIRHLENAHTLDPKNTDIAWELATAYSMARRADHAFPMLEKAGKKALSSYRCYANFTGLQGDPRFEQVFGIPSPEFKHTVFLPQIRVAFLNWESRDTRGRQRRLPPPPKIPKLVPTRLNKLERLLDCGHLLFVLRRPRTVTQKDTSNRWLALGIEPGCAAAMKLRDPDARMITQAFVQPQTDRPLTPKMASDILGCADIKLEAVVLQKRTRSGIEAAFVASADGKQAVIRVDAVAGISVAIVSKSPILITETLAEKLYVRGKSGSPLTLRGVIRKLRKGKSSSR